MNTLHAIMRTPTWAAPPPASAATAPAPPAAKAPADRVSLSTKIQVSAVATVGGGALFGGLASIGAACASAGAVAGTLGVVATTVGLALLAGYSSAKSDHSASRMGGLVGLVLGGMGGLIGSGCGAMFGWPGAAVLTGLGIVAGGLAARGFIHQQQGSRA